MKRATPKNATAETNTRQMLFMPGKFKVTFFANKYEKLLLLRVKKAKKNIRYSTLRYIFDGVYFML